MSPHTPPHLHVVRRGCAALTGALALAVLVGCAPDDRAVPAASAPVSSPEDNATESQASGDAGADETHAEPAPDLAEEDSPSQPGTLPPDGENPPATLGDGVAPARVEIPGIGVTEDLIDLGLQDDGTMEVPSDWDRAGWFTGGSRPGGSGATVIAGHVDSPTGPAVFFRLTELDVGDRVEITDADGSAHHYEVYRIEDLPKDDYPTHLVFGATPEDELRLVTCTGEFDGAALRHLDNRVVFARAVEP